MDQQPPGMNVSLPPAGTAQMPSRDEQHKSVARYALNLVEQATIPVAEMKNIQTLMSWLHAVIQGDLVVSDREPDGRTSGHDAGM